ncbi:MAG: CHAD domain-containing protein [Dermatophilaceae bacterium]
MTAEPRLDEVPAASVTPGTTHETQAPRDAEQQEHVEMERTFDVPRRWTSPRLDAVVGVARVDSRPAFTQTAAYLDTIGLDLLRAKHTLRRRVGGHDAGWHLKKPRDDGSRLEMAQPLGSSATRVPEPFRGELADIARPKPLVRVASLRTRRIERALVGTDGRCLAVLADDTVEATVFLFGERIYRWREIEVELVDGDVALLDAVTQALVAAGLTVSAHQSKLGRALRDALARLDHPPALRGEDVVLSYVAAQVGVLQWAEADVRADNPDAVHKSRVATRRLRSARRTFRPLLDRSVTDPLRREVRWLTGVLGAPRDAEVLLRRFQSMTKDLEPELVDGASVQRLQAYLQAKHERSHAQLVAALDGSRYERLMGSLANLVIDPPWQPAAHESADRVIPRLVRRTAKQVSRAVDAAQQGQEPGARDEALHDVRKRIKAARYAAEAAAHVVRGASEQTETWTGLQDTLGEYQDSIVARQVIATVSQQARRSHEDTFTYGVLGEREAATARAILGDSAQVLSTAHAAARRKVKARKS